MAKDKRFEVIYTLGVTDIVRVLLDTQTGVQYLQCIQGYAGGLTPLLDKDGKPLRWPLEGE